MAVVKDVYLNHPVKRTKLLLDFPSPRLRGLGQEVTPMAWDVMVATAFVVVSVAVLVRFVFKFILNRLKKTLPHPP
jgi:hypothetical protein